VAVDDEYQPDDFDPERDQNQEYMFGLIDFYGEGAYGDGTAHDLFWEVMYNDELTAEQREDFYEQLSVYLYDEYGLDFEDLWDWEDFREWYALA
jgi:hypothetical protein